MATNTYFLLSLIFYFVCSVNGFLDGEKIIGGEDITIRQAPYQLSLRHNTTHVCGASIIKRQWALTAAYCFISEENDGLYDLLSGTDQLNQGGRTHPITKLYINPNFVHNSVDYDIALIFTYEPFEFSDVRQPIAIATSEPREGDVLFISGWGLTQFSSDQPTQLQGVSLPYVDQEACENIYGSSFITDREFCAGVKGKAPCATDNGGPAVFNNTQVGIVSFGVCRESEILSIFTNLANLDIQNWIQNVTGF